jgi:N-acyl-D-amino-acid deacylase
VTDLATFDNPHQYPAGIEYVIVNGQIVVEHGEQHPVLPGKVLKKHV